MTTTFRRAAAALCTLIVLCGLSSVPASAAEGAAWGYCWIGADGVPLPGRGASSSGIACQSARTSAGRYWVTFPGVISPEPTPMAHVSAAVAAARCQTPDGYDMFSNDSVQLGVKCSDGTTGAARDAAFLVTFTVPSGTPGGGPGDYAHVIVDVPTPDLYFLSSGAAPVVTKPATGRWVVRLPGLTQTGGNAQVTTYFEPASCAALSWDVVSAAVQVTVECRRADAGRALTDDAYFTLEYSRARNLLGTVSGDFGYLRSDQPTTGPYAYNKSGRASTVTGSGGTYTATVPLISESGPFTVQVTAVSPSQNTCDVVNWYRLRVDGLPQATGQIMCQGPSGAAAATSFSLAFTG